MKQLLQSLKNGKTEVTSVPCPIVNRGQLLIGTSRSLVSAGTERMLVDFGKANFIDKARQQPDKVRMVLNKIKTDGLMPTIETVLNKLDQPLPMGYCNVGVVVDVGRGVAGFTEGDRVASNGKHAEIVSVPMNLCAKVPDEVPEAEKIISLGVEKVAISSAAVDDPDLVSRIAGVVGGQSVV